MNRSLLILTSISYAFFSGGLNYGQVVLFRDDFNGSPAEEWRHFWHLGSRDIVNGWWRFTQEESGESMVAYLEGLPDDLLIRTSVRLLDPPEGGGFATLGVSARGSLDAGQNYAAACLKCPDLASG